MKNVTVTETFKAGDGRFALDVTSRRYSCATCGRYLGTLNTTRFGTGGTIIGECCPKGR